MSKNLLNLLLIVTIFATYYLAIGPLYSGAGGVWQPSNSIGALQAMNTQYDATLGQADGLYSQAQTLRAQYANVSADQKAKMEIMVPNSIDKIRLLDEVNSIGRQTGLAFDSLAYSEGASGGTSPLGTAGVTFTVKTNYSKFKELMDNFEKSLRLYSIQTVSFSGAVKDGDLITYQVKLGTYYLK